MLKLGLPNTVYLVASCRIRCIHACLCSSNKQHCHPTG